MESGRKIPHELCLAA
jgi:hypothetical protein